MTSSVVVGGVLLSGNEGFGVEEGSVSSSSDFVNDSRFEIDVDGSGNVFSLINRNERCQFGCFLVAGRGLNRRREQVRGRRDGRERDNASRREFRGRDEMGLTAPVSEKKVEEAPTPPSLMSRPSGERPCSRV